MAGKMVFLVAWIAPSMVAGGTAIVMPSGVVLPGACLPEPLVSAAGPAELRVGAAFGHPPVIEHHDLVHLVQAVQVVRDQQGGPAGRRGQQVCGQGPAVVRVVVGGGLIQDEHGRVG